MQPNLASPAFKANPYPFYSRLRAEAPVFQVSLPGGQSAWLITRYDDVLAALKDARLVRCPTRRNRKRRRSWSGNCVYPLVRKGGIVALVCSRSSGGCVVAVTKSRSSASNP